MKRWLTGALGGLIFLAGHGLAAAPKPKAILQIHLQVNGEGLSDKQAMPLVLPTGERVLVRALPEVSLKDVLVAEARDTVQGPGLFLKFNPHGTLVLNSTTTQNQGQMLVILLNNRVLYSPVIDMRVGTGEMIIPKPVTRAELQAIQETIKTLQKR